MAQLFSTYVRRAAFRNHTSLTFVVVAMITAMLPASAWADPVAVQSGSFGRSGGDPAAFRLVGDGFTFSAILFLGGEDFGPYRTCTLPTPCNVGDPINFSSSFSGPAFATGPVTFGGTLVSPPPGFSTVVFLADVRVDGPIVDAPPLGSDGLGHLTEPFTFSGSLDARAAQGSPTAYELGPTLFAADFVGSGDARLVLEPAPCPTFNCVPGPPYHVGLLNYGFSPTPEPGTFGLFALAGGLLATRRALRPSRVSRRVTA